MTFNVNDSTAERIDALRLSNRSEWANKVFKDYLDERDESREIVKMRDLVNTDPAARINDIPTAQLGAAFLARLQNEFPDDFKQLKNNLLKGLSRRSFTRSDE